MKTKFLVMIGFVSLCAVTSAYGQGVHLKADIPFTFTAHGKALLSEGEYTFTPNLQQQTIGLHGPNNQASTVPVITRLAGERHTNQKDAHIVFDKVGETYYLSEVWIPGQDGYLLHTTKGKHEHKVIDVPE